LESNYGAETDDLVVPMRAEYFDGSAWRLNTLDNHTSIDFDEAQGHVILTPIGTPDLTGAINNLDSTGVLQNGLSNTSRDMRFNRPQSIGQVQLSLSPLIDSTVFPYYLNFDWNNDGVICNAATCPDTDDAGSDPQQTDFPSAIVTFGLYRGNDRVIQWREVFN
jgi:MSHA biogenesis protein MshQ